MMICQATIVPLHAGKGNMRRMNSSDINTHEWKRIESKVTPSQFVSKYVTSTDGKELALNEQLII